MPTTRRGFLRRALAAVGAALFGSPINKERWYQNEAYQLAALEAKRTAPPLYSDWNLPPRPYEPRLEVYGQEYEEQCEAADAGDYFFNPQQRVESKSRRITVMVCAHCGNDLAHRGVTREFDTVQPCPTCGARKYEYVTRVRS